MGCFGFRYMSISLFWFRRDLRLEDNAGLYHALKAGLPVQPIFIFDTQILDKLSDRSDARVTFIHDALTVLQHQLQILGSTLDVRFGDPIEIWPLLLTEYNISHVFANKDYEPYARDRDAKVATMLSDKKIEFHLFKDQVIFEELEVTKDDGKPYTVFTPYSRKWLAKLDTKQATDDSNTSYYLQPYPTESYAYNYNKQAQKPLPTLADIGFGRTSIDIPPATITRQLIKEYADNRNFPAIPGTSRLGIHFRFGTISIRQKVHAAQGLSAVFLSELIWRDFYSQILANFPQVVQGPFKSNYAGIEWRDDSIGFAAWCAGQTGFPLVDAGMRELNSTGFMHNRVRMLVASFLCKHLLIDWRLGEAYFAEKLLDFDLASNNGGWQWAAGCGTDAAPYFRIFSPDAQLEKFDKQRVYVKKWVPEYGNSAYVKPIVDHAKARERCLEVYKLGIMNYEL
jgi:deoxyribodipyrimidine photo-lyase